MIPIGIRIGQEWRTAQVYVDSGSMYTILAPSLVPGSFDWKAGRNAQATSGTGQTLAVFLHDLDIQIGNDRFVAPVGFSSDLKIGFDILGRRGIFDRYRIEFNEPKRFVSFTSVK
ncbi:MAG: hypothetical protein HYY13_00645 [Nitrospirae bacterium]|nr:hypothetical protein [Nitrospirota bacterium]